MNRRNFLSSITKAAFGFTILPPSTTYERIWKATRIIPNPDWIKAEYKIEFISSVDFLQSPEVFKENYKNFGARIQIIV